MKALIKFLKIIYISKIFLSNSLYGVSNSAFESKIKNHSIQLKKLNTSADILFAQIMALQLGKQYSTDERIDSGLISAGLNLRKQINSTYNDFINNF